ncbi:MAG: putative transposase [Thermomicrobiales bacterium]|nr:putative transposase [Thermomicrobiales bacterium]
MVTMQGVVGSLLTAILEDYRRAVAGYRLGFAVPSALQNALALRDAITAKPGPHWHVCGILATFATDHSARRSCASC